MFSTFTWSSTTAYRTLNNIHTEEISSQTTRQLTIISQCVAGRISVCSSKVKATLRGQMSKYWVLFRVRFIIFHSLMDLEIPLKMLTIIRRCVARKTWSVAPRSRSHLSQMLKRTCIRIKSQHSFLCPMSHSGGISVLWTQF